MRSCNAFHRMVATWVNCNGEDLGGLMKCRSIIATDCVFFSFSFSGCFVL